MIYLHVPFCRTFCTYCSFYSERFRLQDAEPYVEALLQEIGRREEEIRKTLALNTLYIGGGTPSVLPPSALARIIQALSRLTGGRYEEFTVEVNPDDVTAEYAVFLKELGVTRVSMGVQSFDDTALKRMARRHTAEGAVRSYVALREAGFDNISLDLIFGRGTMAADRAAGAIAEAPEGEAFARSQAAWTRDLDVLLSLPGGPPEHVSAYQLSIEEGSALYQMVEKGRYRELSDEACERQYLMLCERLAEAGYEHYEISNFARPGFRAIHNSAYWSGAPYVGLGPAAHSYDGSKRRWNPDSLEKWAQTICTGSSIAALRKSAKNEVEPCSTEEWGETLTAEQKRTERIMLSLRTCEGIPERELRALCGDEKVEEMLRGGLLERIVARSHPAAATPQQPVAPEQPAAPQPSAAPRPISIRIPERKWFVGDAIVSDLL